MGNNTETSTYDVVVIGGGPVGENAADYAIRGSDRTAVIIEHELVGGECSYWACMPSKGLLGPGAALAAAHALPGARERQSAPLPEPSAVLERRDTITGARDDTSQVDWARGAGIEVIRGHGRIVGEREVSVGDRRIHAREAVVVATGSTASIPPVAGLREALPWTSRDATNLVDIPQRIVVLGGGVVACEAATWLLDLGVREVTMVVRGHRLLPKNEPFVGEMVAEALTERGADIRFGTQFDSVHRPEVADTGYGHLHGGPAQVTLSGSGEVLEVDEILVAAGRAPATTDLGLGSIGAEESGPLRTDDHMIVPGHPWLYAVGDVNGRVALTHMGKYQARVAGDVIAARAEGRNLDSPRYSAFADHSAVPQVVFTRPEVAVVGLTEQQARDRGIDVTVADMDLAVAGTYLLDPDYSGQAKLVIDRSRDVIIGATFVGAGTAELVHSATVAVVGEVTLDRLWHAVPSYPTVSEIWLRLLESLR
ncbi:MAG: pyridine nucleotide-disulfide oxidoreductase [Gordonia sp.]|uniref:dihydrolipoyl dehydrogenase family protein n=1 Tax=Gordonia sp. (in: high G+C Gram-positive bacteria) TaxID=84139 RepID=UPI000C5D410E|nr:NAD(P)/FAD-dependent oxidoreductase [Gordonia sp. (in: high G+C Gram-positive bacteria)]MAU81377.1 pyridine nucleotide-disulfide oxidoreductase [Gordonia sp. (in: high G+C Gram-positive bacteria)]